MVEHNSGHEGKLLAGKYILRERLASGGMGEVYLAEHHLLNEPRAIKIIREELLGEPSIRKRFMQEIEITHKLSRTNKHIVSLYDDYGFEQGLGYYVMEYLQGDTLSSRIRQSPGSLPIDWCVNIVIAICQAMEPVHRAGVIHRDLKPGNIFLVTEDSALDFVKIVDFGVARATSLASEITSSGVWVGTLSYMSPEQLTWTSAQDAYNPLDGRVDIYALGCIFFQMLTGRRPFVINNPGSALGMNQMMMAHLYEPIPSASAFRPDVPVYLEQVIFTAMAKAREARFQSMQEFGDTLLHWICEPILSVRDTIAFVPPSLPLDHERTYETTSPFAHLATSMPDAPIDAWDEHPLTPSPLATADGIVDTRLPRLRSPQKTADSLPGELDVAIDLIESGANGSYWPHLKWLISGLCCGLLILVWRVTSKQGDTPVLVKRSSFPIRDHSLPPIQREHRWPARRLGGGKTRPLQRDAGLRSTAATAGPIKVLNIKKRRRKKRFRRRPPKLKSALLKRMMSGQTPQIPQVLPSTLLKKNPGKPAIPARVAAATRADSEGLECQLESGLILKFMSSVDRAIVNIGEMHGLQLGVMACLYKGRQRKSVAPSDCIAVAMVGELTTKSSTLILARKTGIVTTGMRVCFIKRF